MKTEKITVVDSCGYADKCYEVNFTPAMPCSSCPKLKPEQKDTDVTQSEYVLYDEAEYNRISQMFGRIQRVCDATVNDFRHHLSIAVSKEITSLRAENERLKKELETKGNSIC